MKLATLCCIMIAGASAHATIWGFAVPLIEESQEVPPTGSTAYGTASYTIDDLTWIISGSVTVTGIPLTGVTGMHIHNAPMGVNGPIIFNILANTVNSFQSGNVANWFFTGIVDDTPIFREQKLAEMVAGRTYINVHTPAFPGGEIRGQIDCVVPEPGTVAALVIGLSMLSLLRRRK